MDDTAPLSLRDRIRAVAEEFYVLRGYDGFSFGDVAAATNTTRANIHHHFGSKQQLMAQLAERFCADAEQRIAQHWTAPGLSFAERLDRQRADLRAFYDRYNPEEGTRNVWSPISRLRLDLPVLGQLAVDGLGRVNRAYDECLGQAVNDAVAAGALAPDTPVADIVRLLRVTLMSCGPITQDTGSFQEVDGLLDALARTVMAAWGRPGNASSG